MNINQACEAFKKLLEEQQARIAAMDCTKTDFTTKKTVTIGVIDGDVSEFGMVRHGLGGYGTDGCGLGGQAHAEHRC